MKKILLSLLMIFLCTGIFAQEISNQIEQNEQPVIQKNADNHFSAGIGISLLGPEISLNYHQKSWEIQAGYVPFDMTGLGNAYFLQNGNFGFYGKFNAGYIFPDAKKTKWKFAVGGNVDLFTSLEDIPIFAFGAYGKAYRTYGKHFELSFEYYLPVHFTFIDYKDINPEEIVPTMLFAPGIGFFLPAVYVKYTF